MEGREVDQNGTVPNVTGLDAIMAGLEALIDDKQQTVDRMTAALAVEQAELRRLRSMQRAGNPEARPKPGPKPKGGSRTGEEELRIVADRIRNLPTDKTADPTVPGSFTLRTLKRELGMEKNHAERALTGMRDREMIRLVGQVKESHAPRPSRLFVLNDDE